MWPDIISVHLHDPGLNASYKSACDDHRLSELRECNMDISPLSSNWNPGIVVDSHAVCLFVCSTST